MVAFFLFSVIGSELVLPRITLNYMLLSQRTKTEQMLPGWFLSDSNNTRRFVSFAQETSDCRLMCDSSVASVRVNPCRAACKGGLRPALIQNWTGEGEWCKRGGW